MLGQSIHVLILSVKARIGIIMKGERFILKGWVCSFENSLIASAIGWGIPIILTLFGPFRNWIYPRIFRSKRVKKDIPKIALSKEIIIEIKKDSVILFIGVKIKRRFELLIKIFKIFCFLNVLSKNKSRKNRTFLLLV